MITTLIILAGLLLAVLSYRNNRTSYIDKDGDLIKFPIGPIVIAVLGIVVALFQPYSFERVDAGHVGIKVNLTGDERGVSKYSYKTGWVAYNNWTEKLYEFPTYQQHIEYEDQTVITKGGFAATIKPTFNYSLKPEQVGDMFEKLRLSIKEIEGGWLKTAIVGSVNDVANKWAVDSIFNHREGFESAIIVECNKRVISWFLISQLRTNILPPEALKSSIENKTRAVQDAQAALQLALVADAKAKEKIAIARGDSAGLVINASAAAQSAIITADGEARAMKLKQQQLSPLYVEYIKSERWDGKLPTTVLGSNGAFLNLK